MAAQSGKRSDKSLQNNRHSITNTADRTNRSDDYKMPVIRNSTATGAFRDFCGSLLSF
jgi:hypothetical protein